HTTRVLALMHNTPTPTLFPYTTLFRSINTPLIRHRDSTKRRQILWLVEPLSRGHVRDSDRVRRSNQRLELIKNVHHGLRITHVWLRRPLHNVTERSTRDITKLLASDLRNVLIGLVLFGLD